MPKKVRVVWVLTCIFILIGFFIITIQGKIRANRQITEKRAEQAQKIYEERMKKKQAAMALEKKVATIREVIASGRNEEALKLAEEILADDSQNAKAITWKGVAQVKLGDLEAGLKSFRESATIDPNWAKTYHYWGLTLSMKGLYQEAIDKYENALLLEPENSNSYAYWGAALVQLKDYPKAIDQLEKSIGLNPKNEMAYGILLDAYFHQGQFAKAWETVARARKWKVEIPEASVKRLRESSPEPVSSP